MRILTRLQSAVRLGYSIGLGQSRIAEYYGTSPNVVRVIACRHGWTKPKRTGVSVSNVPCMMLADYKHLVYRKRFRPAEAFKVLHIDPKPV